MTIEEIRGIEDGKGGLHQLLGMHTINVDEEGRFSLEVKVTQQLLNPFGIVHGGTIFTLCDTAVGTYVAYGKRRAVTLDGAIHYYRPGMPESTLRAIVKERKSGRTMGKFLVEVFDDKDNHIADATFTMYYTDQK